MGDGRTHGQRNNQLRAQPSEEMHENKVRLEHSASSDQVTIKLDEILDDLSKDEGFFDNFDTCYVKNNRNLPKDCVNLPICASSLNFCRAEMMVLLAKMTVTLIWSMGPSSIGG